MNPENAALSPFGIKATGPTIHQLPPAARAFLERRGSVRVYRRDEEVLRHRVAPHSASWLQTGRLRSVVYLPDGGEHNAGWLMPGDVFGVYNMLLSGSPSRSNVLVDTEEARVLHFSREVLLEMMADMPDARVGVVMLLSHRIMQFHDVIDIGGARALPDKIRAVLLWWCKQYGLPARDGSVELWVSQGDLANAVGASRQRVHQELQNLRDEGELTLAYRKLILRPRFFAAPMAEVV